MMYCLRYPEQEWPEWASRPNRTLVIDDLTKLKDMLVEDNETDASGKEVANLMRVFGAANKEMEDIMTSVLAKPQHVIATAFAEVRPEKNPLRETLGPDVPPGMNKFLTREFSNVYYVDKTVWRLRLTTLRETYRRLDVKGKEWETVTRTTMAKHKLPEGLEGKGLLADLE